MKRLSENNKFLVQYWHDGRFFARIEYFEGVCTLMSSALKLRLDVYWIRPNNSPLKVRCTHDESMRAFFAYTLDDKNDMVGCCFY